MPKLRPTQDEPAIRHYLESSVRKFAETREPIAAIEIGFEVCQAGWVFVHADRRPRHRRDGTWSAGLDEPGSDILELKHWVGVDPSKAGELILKVVNVARADGVFDALGKREAILVDIEDFDGEWSWPEAAETHSSDSAADVRAVVPNPRLQATLDKVAAKDAAITDLRCPFCQRPCPSYRITCKHCRKTVPREA